jgi:hypothetical protein
VLSGFTQGNWTFVPAGNTFVFTVFSAMLLILCQAHLFNLNFTHASFADRIIDGFFFPSQRTELALKAREAIPFFSYAAMPVPDSCSTVYVSTKLSEKVTVKVFRESAHKEICYFHAADSQRTLDISPFDGTRISLAYGHPSQKSRFTKVISSKFSQPYRAPTLFRISPKRRTKRCLVIDIKSHDSQGTSSFVRLQFRRSETGQSILPLFNLTENLHQAKGNPYQIKFLSKKRRTLPTRSYKPTLTSTQQIGAKKGVGIIEITSVIIPPTEQVFHSRMSPVVFFAWMVAFVVAAVCMIGVVKKRDKREWSRKVHERQFPNLAFFPQISDSSF